MLGTPLDPHAFPSPRLPLIVHTSVLPGGYGTGWDGTVFAPSAF